MILPSTSRGTKEDVTHNRVHGQHLCVGCGLCALVCPTRALVMTYTAHRQFEPILQPGRCTRCGGCRHYCPVEVQELKAAAFRTSSLPDPLISGLEGASCFVAYDQDPVRRRQSASGGVATAVLSRLLAEGKVDAVIHADRISNPIGAPHYSVCVSHTIAECDGRRGSFYGPLCYEKSLEIFRGTTARLAITGVPCVLSGFARLFREHAEFVGIQPLLIGLVCSHNVTGQFVDYLARAMGGSEGLPFEADLRDKTDLPDANNFNTCLRSGTQVLVRVNRFWTPFTSLWRSQCFALEACHYCSNFWGEMADISIKDAWGKWAEDPLGKSIIAVRNQEIRSLLEESPFLEMEPLPLEQAARCQMATSLYKLTTVPSRFEQSWLSKENRQSGFAFNFAASHISRNLYRWMGFRVSQPLLNAFLRLAGRQNRWGGALPADFPGRLRDRLLSELPHPTREVALFGAGAMARELLSALSDRISVVVDNDESKQGTNLKGKPVLAPEYLIERKNPPFILIGIAQDEAVAIQLKRYGFREGKDFLRCRLHHAVAIEHHIRSTSPKRTRKILVLGGFGYDNTGDEAQLNANLQDLTRLFPDHLIKVLSPNPVYTHLQHDRCAVSDAPRTAFFDAGETSLYNLPSRWAKVRFLLRSCWLYFNAFLIHAGLPTFLLKAKRCSLLHELATADLVFFSGGGYLTGSTLSRLWDGLFFIGFAHVLRVPVVLSGQTIGVWNSRFTRRLATWGFQKAELISVRDADESMKALSDLGLGRGRFFATCDDALFCAKEPDQEILTSALRRSGLPSGASYLALNIHYWGLTNSKERSDLLVQIARISQWARNLCGVELLGIPMIPSDLEALEDLANMAPLLDLKLLDYDFDFRTVRAVIAGAHICLTMKHHPIIFAMGEGVPAISLVRGAYYHHKNRGALQLFGMSSCNIDLEHEDYFERFQDALRRVQEDRDKILNQIRSSRINLKACREQFFKRVSTVLSIP